MSIHITLIYLLLAIILFRYILFICSTPFLYVYSYLHRRRNRRNVVGNISEKNSLNDFSIIFKRRILNFADGFYRYCVYVVSTIPSHHIRNFYYRNIFLVNMKKNAVVYYGAEIRAPYMLTIGEGTVIGDKSIIDARRGGVILGRNVNIGTDVSFWTGQHDYNDPWFRSLPNKRGPIVVEDRVWIGPRVTILHSVTIGEGAVIAAGAVVTKDVPPFTVVGGIPAKILTERNRDLKYEFNGLHLDFL